MGREKRKQVHKTMFSRPNLQEILTQSGIKRELGSVYKVGGDAPFIQTHNLAGANKLLWQHDPGDGDTWEGWHDTDNTYRIYNPTTAQTAAWFYRDGRVFVDLINDAVELHQIHDDIKNASQGTHSLRSLGSNHGGSSVQGSPANHSHSSVNFNKRYAPEDMMKVADIRAEVEKMRKDPKHKELRPVLDLLLDLAHQLIDEVDMRCEEKARRLMDDKAFAHEFYMKYDDEYFAAWMLEHDPDYRAKTGGDERIVKMAANGHSKHGTIENDPVVVSEFNRKHQGRL